MASTQRLSLGRSADLMRAALDQLKTQRFVERLWANDPSLWGTDAALQAAIRRRLGWLQAPRWMRPQCASLLDFAQEIRRAGCMQAVLLGMGGSGLFAEVCRHTFGGGGPTATRGMDVTVLDTTDPTAIRSLQQRCPPDQLVVIVSSKSGATAEVSALAASFYDALRQAGVEPGTHCIAITDAGTPLEAQARTWKFRRIFTHGPKTGDDVGGRFSALTYFGLVPASLMGIDPDTLLARALEMLSRCGPDIPLQDNPAAQLGATLGGLARAGRDKLTLLCAPELSSVGTWVEQLIAESTGKQGRGITPIHGERWCAPEAYGADRVFVVWQLAGHPDAALEAHLRGLELSGQPIVRVRWEDRYDLGGEVIKWSIVTSMVGGFLGVNPFDEPNVKESKDRTNELLAQYVRDRRFPEDTPLLSEPGLALYGSSATPSAGSRSTGQCLRDFLRQARLGDYVAVLSFLPRQPALDHAAHAIRDHLSGALGLPTMLGIGPRYLHSTGQLYKGGPDQGLFLQLTAEEPLDLPIPGEPFTFGILKHAQALADFQAMRHRGRRILRAHLRGDVESAMRQLQHAIEEAV